MSEFSTEEKLRLDLWFLSKGFSAETQRVFICLAFGVRFSLILVVTSEGQRGRSKGQDSRGRQKRDGCSLPGRWPWIRQRAGGEKQSWGCYGQGPMDR